MDDKKDSLGYGSLDNGDIPQADDHSPPNNDSHHDEILERLGLKVHMKRWINTTEMLSLAYNICNSWVGVIVVLQYALYNGGPLTLLYGMILILCMYLCIVSTLAELASVYPTAAGQYHWTAILSPKKYSRGLSYCNAALSFFSWISINAGIVLLNAQLIMAMAALYNPTFKSEPYQYFLMYQLFNLLFVLANCFVVRRTMWTFIAIMAFGIVTYFVVMVTCAARAPTFQTTDFIWSIFDNETGWTGGIAFLSAAVAPNYMYTGIDGAIHMSEEAKNPTSVPQAMFFQLVAGFITAFTFCIATLYSGQDYETILATPTFFPIYELMSEAAQSPTAATIFMVFILITVVYTELGSMVTGSRVTWALGRDNGIVFSGHISRISPRWEAPIWATVFNGVIIFIIGFIYLGSPTVFTSFVATGIILNILSFVMPAILLMARGRSEHYLPKDRPFKIPGVLGWVANFFTVVWPIVGAIFYCWPALAPVDASNMNWASAIIGVMGLFALLNWFIWASRHFHVPKLPDH